MVKLLALNRLNIGRIFLLSIFVVMFLFFATTTFSQTAEEPAPSIGFNFTYPIGELGACNNLEECTNYCEDPVNYNSCAGFAKKNGFYRDDETVYANDEFWQGAQSELGCNSKDSCFDFCSNPQNLEECDAFAKRNEIPGGYVDSPDKAEYLEVAQTTLGCDSAESCSNFCDDPANADKCSNFANQVGLLGGTTQEGPGGCQTAETCGAYCADPANYAQCSSHQGSGFAGPGGCNSEETCRSYCDQNPDECRSYAAGSNGVYVPPSCGQGQYHGPGGVCTGLENTQTAVSCVGSDKYWDGTACHDTPPVGIYPDEPSGHFEPQRRDGKLYNARWML